MLDLFWSWFNTSANMLFYIMVSTGFVIGIILMVAPEAFETLNKALNQEYGFNSDFSRRSKIHQ